MTMVDFPHRHAQDPQWICFKPTHGGLNMPVVHERDCSAAVLTAVVANERRAKQVQDLQAAGYVTTKPRGDYAQISDYLKDVAARERSSTRFFQWCWQQQMSPQRSMALSLEAGLTQADTPKDPKLAEAVRPSDPVTAQPKDIPSFDVPLPVIEPGPDDEWQSDEELASSNYMDGMSLKDLAQKGIVRPWMTERQFNARLKAANQSPQTRLSRAVEALAFDWFTKPARSSQEPSYRPEGTILPSLVPARKVERTGVSPGPIVINAAADLGLEPGNIVGVVRQRQA
jgi:hypothetical protein